MKLNCDSSKSFLILSQLKLFFGKRLIRKIRVLLKKKFNKVRKRIRKLV